MNTKIALAILVIAAVAGCDSAADKADKQKQLMKFEKMEMPTIAPAPTPASTPPAAASTSKKEQTQDSLMTFNKKMEMPTNK